MNDGSMHRMGERRWCQGFLLLVLGFSFLLLIEDWVLISNKKNGRGFVLVRGKMGTKCIGKEKQGHIAEKVFLRPNTLFQLETLSKNITIQIVWPNIVEDHLINNVS